MTRGAGRLRWIAASFLLVSIATRIGLAVFSGEAYALHEWARFIGVGLIFDVAVLPWFLLPWALYDAVVPEFAEHRSWHGWENRWAAVWAVLFLSLLAVIALAEFVFWAEFASRFDFIAVDYLVYTHEVIGNIRQSYPVNSWLAAILGVCAVITWFSWPRGRRRVRSGWMARWSRVAVAGFAAWLGFAVVDQNLADTKSNAYVQQISQNGVYALFHAFWHNELDYDKYYPVLKPADFNGEIRALVREPNAKFTTTQGIDRKITATTPRKDVNVILVSVESLSASFLGRFGNKQGLTPELDRLADRGLLFTKYYATGTRTVRGLEALSVGTPPTPGQSIVRRPKNQGLETLGGELKHNGWEPYWIYGGHGFFDNMNAYFGANGYAVVDRGDMAAEALPIHSENIWGIADEDLFSLAFAKLDRVHARGKRFFAHIMTTSNHRPYTFPENRIDLPQKHRESAVKYTDWAIGDFIRRAALKPWFDKTLFIITADHTASAGGKTDLPPSRYLIPMIWYAPKLIAPGVFGRLMSQIDVAPSLLGWLGLSYKSRFFGYDMFRLAAGRERAFISTYQKLGYLKGGRLVVLDVNRPPAVRAGLPARPNGKPAPTDRQLIREAISWYQSASFYFRSGQLKDAAGPENR